MACIATAIATEANRPKRHLDYWKDLITSHLFGPGEATKDLAPILGTPAVIVGNEENFKLYRIPGFDNILVKAVPRLRTNLKNEDITIDTNNNVTTTTTTSTPVSGIEKENEPAIEILENYLGTKSMDDTVRALQGIRDMLKSGVLTAQREDTEVRPKETVFVIPPMTPLPPPPLMFRAPMPMVQNFVLPDLRPVPVQQILPVPVMPSAQYSFQQMREHGLVTNVFSPNGHGVVVLDSNNAPSPPALLGHSVQHMIPMPFASLPIRPSSPYFPPVVNPPPMFMEPAKIAVQGYPYPYKPCCGRTGLRPPVLIKDTTAAHPRPSFFIERKVPFMRPPMLIQDTVVAPRPPPIIVDRLEKIAGAKIFAHRPIVTIPPFALPSRESIIEQSKNVNVHRLPTPLIPTVASGSGRQDSYKLVNSDGSVTTFTRLSDSDEGYYKTDDGRIFYSRLITDGLPLAANYVEDEEAKKRRKNQYTVTNEEEFKNLFNRDDVQVTYGADKFNNQSKDQETITKFPKLPSSESIELPLKIGGIKDTDDQNKEEETITKFPKLPSIGSIEEGTQSAGNGPSGPSKYSFKQIHEDGSVTQYVSYDSKSSDVVLSQNTPDSRNTQEKFTVMRETYNSADPTHVYKYGDHNSPHLAAVQIEDVSTRFTDKGEVQVKFNAPEYSTHEEMRYAVSKQKGETLTPVVVLSKEPTHVFKYVNHNNPHPTGVQVQDVPTIFTERGEVQVKFNAPEYIAQDSSITHYAVTKNDHDFKDTTKISNHGGEISTPGVVMSKEPTHVFKYVDHNNPQPDDVQVEGVPIRIADRGDIQVKVNAHEPARLDGTKYWSTELHSVPASVAATMPPPVGVTSTLPKDYVYVPPKIDVRHPSTEKVFQNGNFSFKLIHSDVQPSSSSHTNTPAFSSTNPIVVPDEVEVNKQEDSSSYRGDIPEAFS